MDIKEKTAIITGGSRGLGRNTALNLASRGVNIIFTYNSIKSEAEKTLQLIQEYGVNGAMLNLDTANTKLFDAFVQNVEKILQEWKCKTFNYLINNAGTSHHNSIENTTEEELDTLYNVHFKGVFFLTQKLLMLLNDGGSIINISTGLTRFTSPGSAAYASIKGAVEVMTRYLAMELGPRKITVNTIAPGAIQTDFSGGVVRDNPEVNKMIAEHTALGRAGVPDDIGPMIASLLSDSNRWVTGQRIEVSGGMFL